MLFAGTSWPVGGIIPNADEISRKISEGVRQRLTEIWWAGASAGFGYGLIIGCIAGLAIATAYVWCRERQQ